MAEKSVPTASGGLRMKPVATEQDFTTPHPKPKRRVPRVIKALIVLVILVGGLIGAAPYLVSMPAVSGWLMSMVNSRLAGSLHVSQLAMSWGGPLQLSGIKVADPEKRDVLTVERVS